MSKILSLRPILPLALLIVAGCGGSGGSSSGSQKDKTSLSLSASADYNGFSTPVTDSTPEATDADGKTVVKLEAGGRTVAITMPSTLAAGSFDLATAGGATATYTEVARAGGGTWKTVAGTVTVTVTGTNKWNMSLVNARFTTDATIEGNTATGEFTMTGTAYGVPYTVSVGPGGAGSFTASANTSGEDPAFTPNYFLKSVVGDAVAAGATLVDSSYTALKFVSVYSPEATGSYPIDTFVTSSVSLGTGSAAKTYVSTSGTIEVLKTGSKHKFTLKNVVYAADPDSGATGGFTLNGSFEK